MPEVAFVNLLIVAAIAALAPLLLGSAPRIRVPAVVLEILAGVLVGPSGLGWLEVDLPVQVLAVVGLAFLLFLAGLEIDPSALRGPVLKVAGFGYLITLGLGIAAGGLFAYAEWTRAPLLVAIALSATSLGLVVAVLTDARLGGSTAGQLTIAGATVADFCAIVLLTLFFSMTGGGIGHTIGLLTVFAGLVLLTAAGLSRAGRSMSLGAVLLRLQDSTAEIRVRLAVLLLVGLVALAGQLGLEIILGAFLAGTLVGVLDRDRASHPTFRRKLDAIGYGFCIPVFFVASGAQLDLAGLVAEPAALLRVPAFLLALLLVRGLPALLYRHRTGWRGAVAAGLLQATSLPFLVTAGAIGVATGTIAPVTAAALTCAGLVSVMIFPTFALVLLRPGGLGPGAGSAPPDHDRASRQVLQAAPVRSDDQSGQGQADQQGS